MAQDSVFVGRETVERVAVNVASAEKVICFERPRKARYILARIVVILFQGTVKRGAYYREIGELIGEKCLPSARNISDASESCPGVIPYCVRLSAVAVISVIVPASDTDIPL